MDEYSEFSSDDFDVKGWINATVASHLQLLEQTRAAGAVEDGSTNGLIVGGGTATTTLSSTVASRQGFEKLQQQ